jgi:RNA polymerase sigma factor (sigma-70 family)
MATRTAALVPLLTKRPTSPADAATDRDLLRRFARCKDEAAFATLVHRHGAMVLGVCRRVLGNPADAEDACQATFLVLARKAGSARWQPSAASWLYATARQVALNARTARARRAKHEGRALAKPQIGPLAEISGEELLAILDEELGNLPERYRAPVVLCCVEGLSRDEAAAQLGIPTATLKGQLERGRKRLHDALGRRGVTLGAGLLLLATATQGAATPARLVNAIGSAVAGQASPTVSALAEGAAVGGVIKKVLLGAVLAVATVAVGFGLGQPRATTAGPGQDKEMPAKGKVDDPPAKPKAELQAPDGKGPIATGRVYGPDGKALGGAKLYMGRPEGSLELGASDADGKFSVKVPVPAGHFSVFLIARADSVGMDLQFIGVDRLGDGVELRTVTDNPIRGKIVDTQGKPVAGATVALSKLCVFGHESLDEFLDGYKRGDRSPLYPGNATGLWCDTGVLPVVTTDDDGKFAIAGVGAERLAALRVSGSGLAVSELWVVNRKGFDPKPYNESKPEPARPGDGRPPLRPAGSFPLHSPNLSVVGVPEKLIRGTVTDVETGKPRAHVKVTLAPYVQESPPIQYSAVTDAEGKYEIRGAHKALTYLLSVPADPDTGHVVAWLRMGDTPGFAPVRADIQVKKGVVITGTVIDAGTKKPVRGFATVAILHNNKFVKEYPEFEPFDIARFPTDENGVFRIVTIPGPVLLMGGASGGDALIRYKPAVADPKYPQYFGNQQVGGVPGAATPGAVLPYIGVGGNATGTVQGNFCKVLEIKTDAGTVTQDILLELAK